MPVVRAGVAGARCRSSAFVVRRSSSPGRPVGGPVVAVRLAGASPAAVALCSFSTLSDAIDSSIQIGRHDDRDPREQVARLGAERALAAHAAQRAGQAAAAAALHQNHQDQKHRQQRSAES